MKKYEKREIKLDNNSEKGIPRYSKVDIEFEREREREEREKSEREERERREREKKEKEKVRLKISDKESASDILMAEERNILLVKNNKRKNLRKLRK